MDGFAEPILHVDMDAFFVEVERLREPSLSGRPVIVGGLGGRGVVASASYEARAAGVRSAMPMAVARRRCPHAAFVPPDHRRYGEISAQVFETLRSFTPHVEGISVDEAFLDVAGLRLHYPTSEAVAQAIRRALRQHPGLPASVGIARTKFLAKMASQDAKPDGICRVRAGEELGFLHPLPVRRLWGVGEATHAALEGLGVATIGDLAAMAPSVLERRLGKAAGAHLTALAHGIDPRPVAGPAGAKSISVEETYEQDLHTSEEIDRALAVLCHRLESRLRRAAMRGHTVTLKVRFADFTTITRSGSHADPVAHAGEFVAAVRSLWRKVPDGVGGVRLLGVGVTGLERRDDPEQMALDTVDSRAAAAAIEEIRERFGDDSIVPGRLLDPSAGARDASESAD